VGNVERGIEPRVKTRQVAAMPEITFLCGNVDALKQDTKRRNFRSVFEGIIDAILTFR